jgi:hypothetical protein
MPLPMVQGTDLSQPSSIRRQVINLTRASARTRRAERNQRGDCDFGVEIRVCTTSIRKMRGGLSCEAAADYAERVISHPRPATVAFSLGAPIQVSDSSLRTHAAAGNLFLPQHHRLFLRAGVCALFVLVSAPTAMRYRCTSSAICATIICMPFGSVTRLEWCCKKCPLIRVLAQACGMGGWCRLKNSSNGSVLVLIKFIAERIWSEVMQPARRSMGAGLPSRNDEPERKKFARNVGIMIWPIKINSEEHNKRL